MEQILTLAASLEPGKPTSISNEDILPPGKSRTHRFITCLVLGSFLWSTIVPSMAMDVDLREAHKDKPISMAALVWIRQLEQKREAAIAKGRNDCLEALTKEISATIAGRYGISTSPATPEDRKDILESIAKTRRFFENQLNIIHDFYFSHDTSHNKTTSWRRIEDDPRFSSHMAFVVATDGLSWGLLSHEVKAQKAKTYVDLLTQCDHTEKEVQMPLVSRAIKDMVIGVYGAKQSHKERSLLNKLQPKDWDELAGHSISVLDFVLATGNVTPTRDDLDSQRRKIESDIHYTIVRDPTEGDDSVIIIVRRSDGPSNAEFKGKATRADRPAFRPRPGMPPLPKPKLLGTHYADWVRSTCSWMESHEARELFDITVEDPKDIPQVLRLMEIQEFDYTDLKTEAGVKSTSDKRKTILFVRGVLNGMRLKDETLLEIPHVLSSCVEGPRDTKIIKRGDRLYYPKVLKKTYVRPAIPGIVDDRDFEKERSFNVNETICDQSQHIHNGTYETGAEGDYLEEDLFEKDVFRISHPPESLDSPYLWGNGERDTPSVYLTRTIKAIQMETSDEDDQQFEKIKGWIQYTAPTSLRVTIKALPISMGSSSPSGIFENIQRRWIQLNPNNYNPADNGSHYAWDIQDVEVPSGVKKSQFLLDINHAKGILDLSRVKLILSAPFESEEAGEFIGKNVPPSLPGFAIIESAFYPPFPLPTSLESLMLKGTPSSPLALDTAQARAIASLVLLKTLSLQHVTISDADLALSLSQALKNITLKDIQSLGKETVRRLVALRTVPYSPLQELTLSDRLHFTDLFYVIYPNPEDSLKRSMIDLLDGGTRTPQAALDNGNRLKELDPTKARQYYRISALQGNTAKSKEAAYHLAMMLRQDNTSEALTFFERAAGADGRYPLLSSLEGSKIHQERYNSRQAKTLLKLVADHTPTIEEAAKWEATFLLADLFRKGSDDEKPEARTYYGRFGGYTTANYEDRFKGKALLAHGQMFLYGEGGETDYDEALSKLESARRFTNVQTKAFKEWARARFEKARDRLLPEQERRRRKAEIWRLVSDTSDVITHYPPAKVIQGFLYAEGNAPSQHNRQISTKDIGKAIELFEAVVADPLVQHNYRALAMSHHGLGYLHKPGLYGEYADLTKSLQHNLKAANHGHELSKLRYGELLWETYAGSSEKTLIRRALMVSEWYVCSVGHKSEDADMKEKAIELSIKMSETFTANGFKVPSWFDVPDDAEELSLEEEAQAEKDKQAAEAREKQRRLDEEGW